METVVSVQCPPGAGSFLWRPESGTVARQDKGIGIGTGIDIGVGCGNVSGTGTRSDLQVRGISSSPAARLVVGRDGTDQKQRRAHQ